MVRLPVARAAVAGSLVVGFAAIAHAQSRFERISVSSSGEEANAGVSGNGAAMSADGRHVAWDSYASNLAPYDINNSLDVFVRDRATGTTTLVSSALTGLSANNASLFGGISADGRFVAFWSDAYDLVKYDTNRTGDIFLRDRDPDANGVFDEGNETTIRVSVDSAGAEANGRSSLPAISADGTKVAFASDATNLVANDTNGTTDVFVRDVVAGTTERVSVTDAGAQANGYSTWPMISADGALVGFASGATNLVKNDKNNVSDLFLRDRTAGTTIRVSVRSDGGESNGDPMDPSMSADGQRFVWWSWADNLVPGDTNFTNDVFLRDVAAGQTSRLSVSESGAEGDRQSYTSEISRNGLFVLLNSAATNLAGIETNNGGDVFVLDLATSKLSKVSVHLSGKEGAGGSFGYALSDDGLYVAMITNDFGLIGSDANGLQDLLLRDRTIADPEASWTNYGAGWPGTHGIPSLTAGADPVLGRSLDVAIGNSFGFYAVGFLFLGDQAISLPTSVDGTLLVAPLLVEPFLLDPAGTTLTGALPLDDSLAGAKLYLQVLEMDAGASRGVSFTPGLELSLGQ